MATAVATPARSGHTSSSGQSATSSAPAFAAGDMLADRYRIVGLLGRGGMGEVYRADDLKLEQPVSLKFLPRDFADDAAYLERFHAEVRHARQVSHPNVCRVYDIGEFEGRHFISMEYVDGEDLATLLRRIGRLPKTKANEVARQLCAGIAAAHDRGVLHRDLKPSNVMIDGDGRVRITDFGLAVRSGEGGGEVAGTPAYMAPEQFEGKPATVQSDLYALGLVLYEIYTGKRAFEAHSFVEWKSKHTGSAPTSPGMVEHDVDDAVDRVILRCLEKDPSRRPPSAIQLAAALPGGDPLAAALAAGETPSPEMVAAAGGEGAISARRAWSLLVGMIVLISTVVALAPYATDLGLAPMPSGYEVLRDRARQIVTGLGYGAHARDSESHLFRNYDGMRYLALRKPSPVWRREFASWGPPVLLGYRQSPQVLVSHSNDGRTSADDPPFDRSGLVGVVIDATGRLLGFRAVPPQLDSTMAVKAPDWDPLFVLSGLERARFTERSPRWVPPDAFDARAEWTGAAPWARDVPLTVSAAAWHGQPVYFEVHGPWSRPTRMVQETRVRTRQIAEISFMTFFLLVLVGSIALARRNTKLGRGDRRGAVRVGAFVVVLGLVYWAMGAHHVPELRPEIELFARAFGSTIVYAASVMVMYLALEPYVRRRFPELLIGWARVLEGRFRDPRVGHDVLVGGLLGTLAMTVLYLSNAAPTWINIPGQTTIPPNYDALAGGRWLAAFLVNAPLQALGPALFISGLYFLLRLVVRKAWVAAVVLALTTTLVALGGENVLLETPGALVVGILIALVVTRYGLLATASFSLFQFLVSQVPLPIAAPYTAQSIIVLGAMAAIVVYAFRISLGSRPVWKLALDE